MKADYITFGVKDVKKYKELIANPNIECLYFECKGITIKAEKQNISIDPDKNKIHIKNPEFFKTAGGIFE